MVNETAKSRDDNPPLAEQPRFAFSEFVAFSKDLNAEAAARRVYPLVFRRDLAMPGFHIIVLPRHVLSLSLRQFMVSLKNALSNLHHELRGEALEYLSLGRFDQQTTTKLHLDGGPEISFLMLGYEPSSVASHLHIADYSRTACRLGITPVDFLNQHNPMFDSGARLLQPDTITLKDWFEDAPRVLLINNSQTAPGHPRHSPGVLHGASIIRPDPEASRVINSTQIAPARYVEQDASAAEKVFLNTQTISGPIPS